MCTETYLRPVSLINFNGSIVDASTPVYTADNRLRFGDGFFETARVFNGKVAFEQSHIDRITESCILLGLTLPSGFNLNQEVSRLLTAMQLDFARIRIQFYRQGGGRYLPITNHAGFIIEAEDDNVKDYTLSTLNKIGISELYRKDTLSFGNSKHSSALLCVLAANEAKTKGWDDMLLLNTEGYICEAIASNVFLIEQSGRVVTPPLKSGCVAGVMRRQVLTYLEQVEIPFAEQNFTENTLETAQGIFLTNASKGVHEVLNCSGYAYKPLEITEFIIKKLNVSAA